MSNFFFLISFLVFYSLSFTSVFQGINKQVEETKNPVSKAQVEAILNFMQDHKPYLDHYLSLERLATQLDIPSRNLSNIINRHFDKNFFEFINQYRVEESKSLLRSTEYNKSTMLEIMDLSGFNSKATFNTFFKKIVGQTPTQYRKNTGS